MKALFKNGDNDKVISFGVRRSGKGQPFNFKPELCPHSESLHSMKYVGETPYETTSYYVPTMVQFFWLGLILEVEIYKRKIGGGKMVNYQDSQFYAIDQALRKKV